MDDLFKAFVLIGVGVVIGIFLNKCGGGQAPEVRTKVDTTIRFDTIRDTATVTNTRLKTVTKKQPPDTVTDTAYIFSQYFANREYQASYSDSSLDLKASIKVEQNKLDSFGISYELSRQPLNIKLPKYQPNEWRFYAGAALSTETIAPMLTGAKNKFYIQAGYDFAGSTPLVGAGYRLD